MTTPTPPAPLQVLVAEDDRINQKIAARLVERLGHQVHVVGNGREALEAARGQPFDVILMDMEMPELDGQGATRRIRSELPGAAQPWIVALTANDRAEDREACRQAGMDDFLTKPLRPDLLAAALDRCRARSAEGPGPAPVTDPTPVEAALPILDRERLAELAANLGPVAGTVLPSLLGRFPAEGARLVREARQAIAEGRRVEVQRLAHTLRGAGANLGLSDLSATARALETRASAGTSAELEALGDRLEAALGRAVEALEQARREPPTR